MEYAGQIGLYLVGFIALAWIVTSLAGSAPAMLVWKGKLNPLGEEEARRCLELVMSSEIVDPQWAAAERFEPTGAFALSTVPAVKIVAWTNAHESTYLCVYLFGDARMEMDFVTVCNDKSLTTGTTKDGQLLPSRPGSWRQTFSVSNASELWTRHQEAKAYLLGVEDFRPSQGVPDLQDEFARAMRQESTYIRSLPLWQLRTPYWYFVRRSSRHGKSVRQLAEI